MATFDQHVETDLDDLTNAEFGAALTYTPIGGAPVSRQGFFEEHDADRVEGESGTEWVRTATAGVRTDGTKGVVVVTIGDKIRVAGIDWNVARILSSNHGLHRLHCERRERTQLSGATHRRSR